MLCIAAPSLPSNGSTEYTVSVVALSVSLPPCTVAFVPQPASRAPSASAENDRSTSAQARGFYPPAQTPDAVAVS